MRLPHVLLLVLLIVALGLSPGAAAMSVPEPSYDTLPAYVYGTDFVGSDGGGFANLDATAITPYAKLATSLLARPGYSRFDGSCPLQHDTRERLHETIQRTPGVSPGELLERMDVTRSTLRYHLRVLEFEGLVYAERVLGTLRYYPVGTEVDELRAALENEATAPVIETLVREGPTTVSALASTLDRSVSTVSYHLDRLEETGLIERERDGEAVYAQLIGPARTLS